MLFYPRKELSRETSLRYRIIGFSLFFHFLILLVSFFINTIKQSENSIVINLESLSKGAPISFARNVQKIDVASSVNSKAIKKISKNESKAVQVIEKKEVPKVEKTSQISSNSKLNLPKSFKKEAVQKDPKQKKIAPNKPVMKSADIKNTEKKEIESKTDISAKQIKKQPNEKKQKDQIGVEKSEKTLDKKKKFNETVKKVEEKSILPDVNIVVLSNAFNLSQEDMEMRNEIKKHLELPPGFLIDEPIKISFEIGFDGKVRNISSRTSEPLVLYMAIKTALIEARYPAKKCGSKIELVLK